MLKSYLHHYAETFSPYKGGPVCYEDGCLYLGLINLYNATGDASWFDHLKRLAEEQVSPSGALKGYVLEEYNIDNILSGRAFLYLYNETGDERYKAAIDTMAKQLANHPRTKSGNYWHKKRYSYQVWLDGLWMGLPFQIEYAQLTGDEVLLHDAIDQLMRALVLLEVPQTGLYAHGYDEARQQEWADKVTGHNSAHWGRALGWLAMAMVEIVGLISAAQSGQLVVKTQALLNRLLQLQCPSGAWLQVVDQPELPGNYEELSATAMFSYALIKAARLGLGDHFSMPGNKALAQIEIMIQGSSKDHPVMPNICCVAGLGGFDGVYRDGTAHYYTTEIIRPDDIKGVGPFMMASAERKLEEHINQAKSAAAI